MAHHYLSSVKWTAVTAWAALTAYSVGAIRRQLATPTVGNERVWRCTTAGTSLSAEPVWTLTAGSTTTEAGGPVWTEITGKAIWNGDGGGTAWAAPHARTANANASGWMAAGDTCYTGHDHAETQASAMTLTSPGTAASPCYYICVSTAGSVPPVSADMATTATVSSTGGGSNISFAGFAYCEGIGFSAGSVGSNSSCLFTSTSPWWWKLVNCSLKLNTTNTAASISAGNLSSTADDQLLELVNTTMNFGATAQGIIAGDRFTWLATASALAGTSPTTLFLTPAGGKGIIKVCGVDLSAIGSSNLVSVGVGASSAYEFEDCKFGTSFVLTTGSNPGQGGPTVEAINCDSGNTNYFYAKRCYQGTIDQETVIVRTSGSTDGTTPISHKFASSANAKFVSPLVGPWVSFWQNSGAAVTVEAEVVTDNVTLTDAEAWIEVEYQGTANLPLGVFASDRSADILAAGVNQTTSTVAWTTTGLVTPVKQTLSKAVTTDHKGIIRARVCLAKASTTMYVDLLRLTGSGRQYQLMPDCYVNEGAAAPMGQQAC